MQIQLWKIVLHPPGFELGFFGLREDQCSTDWAKGDSLQPSQYQATGSYKRLWQVNHCSVKQFMNAIDVLIRNNNLKLQLNLKVLIIDVSNVRHFQLAVGSLWICWKQMQK